MTRIWRHRPVALRAVPLAVLLALGACSSGEPQSGGTASPIAESGGSIEDLREALRSPDPYDRAARAASLLASLGPEAVPEIRSILEDWTFDLRGSDLVLLIHFWASHDAEAASEWVARGAPPAFREAMLVTATEYWGREDPEAALEALGGALGAQFGAESAQSGVVRGWLAAGGEGLVEHIYGLGYGIERQRALSVYIRARMLKEGPEAAIRWAESLPDDDHRFKLSAFRRLVTWLTAWDPQRAIAFCEEHCYGPYGSNLRMRIARFWLRSDPAATLEWLQSTQADQERDRSVRETVGAWMMADPEGAEAWIRAEQAKGFGPWIQSGLKMYAVNLANKDPLTAIEWARQISDEKDREEALILSAFRWRKRDPEAAEAWLEQSELSEEARAKVMTEIKRGLGAARPSESSGE